MEMYLYVGKEILTEYRIVVVSSYNIATFVDKTLELRCIGAKQHRFMRRENHENLHFGNFWVNIAN